MSEWGRRKGGVSEWGRREKWRRARKRRGGGRQEAGWSTQVIGEKIRVDELGVLDDNTQHKLPDQCRNTAHQVATQHAKMHTLRHVAARRAMLQHSTSAAQPDTTQRARTHVRAGYRGNRTSRICANAWELADGRERGTRVLTAGLYVRADGRARGTRVLTAGLYVRADGRARGTRVLTAGLYAGGREGKGY